AAATTTTAEVTAIAPPAPVAAAVPAAARAAATAAAGSALARLVHVQVAALEVAPVELLDGLLRLLVGGHLDEAEAARAAGAAGAHHRRCFAGPRLREQLAQLFARGVEREISYEQPRPHRLLLGLMPVSGGRHRSPAQRGSGAHLPRRESRQEVER